MIGRWRGENGRAGAVTLVWGRPLVRGAVAATAELELETVDQEAISNDRFTLIALDALEGYGDEIFMQVKLWSRRARSWPRRASTLDPRMQDLRLENLPGAEIVLPGLADLQAGRASVNASAVQAAAPRLRRAGLDAPSAGDGPPAAHMLYRQLADELGNGAHSRYNAILARVASFAGAAELARRG